MKKTAVGLFHILPAESEAHGTKINSLVKHSQIFKKEPVQKQAQILRKIYLFRRMFNTSLDGGIDSHSQTPR